MKITSVPRKFVIGTLLVGSLTVSAYAQPGSPTLYDSPEVTVPDTEEPPGPWPTRVSGANLNVRMPSGSVLGGTGSNNLDVSLDGFGPAIKWSESRHNEGDIAVLIGMSDTSSFSDPPAGPVENYAETTGSTTHGWRVNQVFGAAMATVRANGRNNLDTFSGGGPVGTFYGSGHFNQGFGQGWSYNMITGNYTNGGDGAMDLVMGYVGPPDEANIDMGMSFFPYAQHWVGGSVDGDAPSGEGGEAAWISFTVAEQGYSSRNVNRLPDVSPVVWESDEEGLARVQFTNGPAPERGMLFVSSVDDDSQLNLVSAHPNNGGWNVAARNDEDPDANNVSVRSGNESDFQFLYVPWNSKNLIGAHVAGGNGNTIQGAGGYTISRSGAGEYVLTIPGKADDDGMLLLSNAGGTPALPDAGFLSYQYDVERNAFVIQARQFDVNGDIGDPANWSWPLSDTDFYFAWVDFSQPLDPQVGEFTGDMVINAADIDALTAQINSGANNATFNLYLDGEVNTVDRDFLVRNVLRTDYGDVNLDGSIDAADAAIMFANWSNNGGWGAGNVNGDNTIDAADAGLMFSFWTGDSDPVQGVPEPVNGLLWLVLGACALRVRTRV